jgi:hypothetical protein
MAQEHRIMFADNPWVIQMKRDPVLKSVQAYRPEGATIDLPVEQAVSAIINKPVDINADREEFIRDPAGMFNERREYGTLGKGYYGSAVETINGNAIKKFSVKDGYGCWIAFCAFAYRRGTGNAALPRVYALALPKYESDSEYGYALMEKLDKNPDQHPWETAKKLATIHYNVANGMPLEVKHLSPLERLWGEFSAMMRKRSIDVGVDMHDGNILWRGKQFVVTDPVAGGHGVPFDRYLEFQKHCAEMCSMFDARFYVQMNAVTVLKTTLM